MTRKVILILAIVLAIAIAGMIYLFAFGTPQSATSPVGSAAIGTLVAGGVAPAPDPSSPFAVQIPGCVCHSEDPALVEQHADYRMNQCAGCHVGGMPEMAQ